MNKPSRGNEIPAELFQILNADAVKLLQSICWKIWKSQQWLQDWKKSISISSPKKDNAKECSNYNKIVLISHASKVMLKVLQTRLQYMKFFMYMNWDLPNAQPRFRKGRGIRDHIANIHWIIEKAREFQKKKKICFIDCAKALTVLITINHGKFWKRWKYQNALPASWEICIQARKQQWEPVMEQWTIQNWERITSGYILSSCLFNLHAQYIMGHAMLDESQSGIKFSGRNINKSRYADETTLMEESKGELCFRGRERASWRWKRGVKNLS